MTFDRDALVAGRKDVSCTEYEISSEHSPSKQDPLDNTLHIYHVLRSAMADVLSERSSGSSAGGT